LVRLDEQFFFSGGGVGCQNIFPAKMAKHPPTETLALWQKLHRVPKNTTHQLWNGIARNLKDRFWWRLAWMFKRPWNRVCMFQFSCRFAFLSTFRPSNRKVDKEPNLHGNGNMQTLP